MSEERKVNLVFAAENQTKGTLNEIKQDVAGTAAGIEQSGKRAAKGIEGLGEAVKKAGKDSADGLKKFGDGFKEVGEQSKQAEEQVSRVERVLIQAIQRTTAAAEAGEKGTAKYFEVLARQRGAGGDVLEPYLAQLRAAEIAQNKLGVSAGQTQAALRQLPAQFSDIVVSLQGGQAPLTVFLQQGSQIKDSFGGAGQAVKAMGGYVLGMVNPLTVATAAAAALGVAYYQGSKEAEAFVSSIVLTGNASGVTTSQLREYSREISNAVGTQAQAAAGLSAFVDAGIRGGVELKRYTQTAIEWEKATGQAVDKTAEKFADLQKEPLKAVLKLNEGANFLTTSVYEQIKALEDQGDKVGAARVAMDALDTSMRERSKAIKESLGYIQRGWEGITGAAAKAWGAMLNVGRPATIDDQLAGVREELSRLLAQSETGFGETAGGAATGRSNAAQVRKIQERINALRAEEWALNDKADAERMAAAASAESARQMEALASFDKDYAKALDKGTTLQEKLTKARKEGVEAGKSEADIKRVLAYVTEEHNKANKGSGAAAKAAKKELADQAKVYAELADVSSTYYDDLARGQKQLAKGEITRDQYIKYVEDLIKKQPFAIALAKEEEKARKDLQKAIEDDIKQADRVADKRQAGIKSVEDALLKARQEEQAHALAIAANITLAEAMERLTIARLEDHLAQARAGAESQTTIDALERELRARKELQGVLEQKGVREANTKAKKEIEKEWDKTSELIGRTLSDYIMGGGKDAAQYLKRLFATLVLQPIVQYGVNSAMGALGVGQQGSAVQSVLGGNNVGTTVLNNAGLIGAGYQAAFGASVGASSASLFGANAVGMAGGDALGALISGNGMWAGVATGAQATAQAAVAANMALEAGTAVALEAGTLGTAIGTGATTAAAGAGSMMAGVMAAAPYLAAVVALYAIISGMDDSGTPHSGAGAVYSKATGVQSGAEIYNQGTFGMGHRDEYSEDMQAGISGIAQGLGQTLDAFAVSFGKTAGYSVATAFADDSSKDGSWGSLKISDELGKVLVNWEDSRASKWAPREFADGEDGYKEYLKAVAVDVKTAFLTMDLPAWANQALKAATDIDTLTAALQQIATIKSVFDGLGKTMAIFADLTGDAQTRLLAASGGVDALASNASAFYESFYSEGERAQKQRELQMQSLGSMGLYIDPFQGDAANEMFRLTVEEAMKSGQFELGASLMAMSASFKQTADYGQALLDATAEAARDAADIAAAAAKDAALEAAATAASWTGLAQVLAMFSGITAEMQAGLLEAAGTMEALSSGAQDFSQGFYSGDERMLRQRETQMAALAGMGLYIDPAEGDKAKTLFRKTVEEAMASGQIALVVKLQAMSGAFAETADYAQQFLDNMTEAAKQAAQTAVQAMSGAWSNFGTMAGLAAQYNGNTAGLSQQLGVVQGSYANATTTEGRVGALQQIINLEQGLWNGQQAARQAEAAAATARANAAREQVNAAKQLLSAAQGLGSYAKSLGFSEASGLGDKERLAALVAQRQGLLAKVNTGDVGAMQELQGITNSYLALEQQMAVSQQDYSVLSGRIAAELAATAAIQEASASSQVSQYERQIAAAESVASSSAEQFKVSAATQKLIDELLVESATAFENEATLTQKLIDQGAMTAAALQSLPAELAGAIGASLIPAIAGLASAISSAAGVSVPQFAAGGFHAGGLRIVGERGPELEATGPSRIWNQSQLAGAFGGGGNVELLAENRALRTRVESLEKHMARAADAMETMSRHIANVTDNGNAMLIVTPEELA